MFSKMKRGNKMTFEKIKSLAIKIIAATFSAIFIWQAAFGFWQVQISRGLYIMFALVLAFLVSPNRKEKPKIYQQIIDFALIGLSIFVSVYFIVNYEFFAINAGKPLSNFVIGMGIVTIILILEATRRTIGWSLAILTFLFLLYTYFGRLMPAIIAHRGYSISRIISVMYASTEGIFGSVVYVFANLIFLFVIFGSFLTASGAAKFFVELSKAAVGRFTGGAAQSAVVSSWLLGSVIGSSTANTAITGSITIPMMISRGYKRHIAAAVEAVVSIGGQFMPPIMGAAAFLIAAFVGIPYIEVAKAGLIPAVLFFLSMVFMVYLESKRLGLKGIPVKELPKLKTVFLGGWYHFLPIVIIISLLVAGFSTSLAGFYAIVSTVVLSWLNKETRMRPKQIFNALAEGARNSLSLSVTAGAVGILVAAITLPGLGLKFSSIILELANGNLPLALALVMAASFVLGMGMNVSSAYLVLITLAAPALVEMGVPLLTAHFFVFWTSQLSVITPPVALSAYVAAAIAKADVWKTGWYSLRMGLSIYYLPIMFVYIPALLWIGSTGEVIWAFTTTLFGVLAFSALMQGYLLTETKITDRILLGIGAISLVFPDLLTDFVGFAIIILVVAIQYFRSKNKNLKPKNA
jgi:TRAP transporter 4TM/12TM fusion protein